MNFTVGDPFLLSGKVDEIIEILRAARRERKAAKKRHDRAREKLKGVKKRLEGAKRQIEKAITKRMKRLEAIQVVCTNSRNLEAPTKSPELKDTELNNIKAFFKTTNLHHDNEHGNVSMENECEIVAIEINRQPMTLGTPSSNRVTHDNLSDQSQIDIGGAHEQPLTYAAQVSAAAEIVYEEQAIATSKRYEQPGTSQKHTEGSDGRSDSVSDHQIVQTARAQKISCEYDAQENVAAESANLPLSARHQDAFELSYTILKPQAVAEAPRSRDGRLIFSHHLYRGPDGQEVRIHYCDSAALANKVASVFEGQRLLGLDLEWSQQKAGTISLVQISSPTDIALFHIALYEVKDVTNLLPATIRAMLANRDVYKTGSRVRTDATKIERILNCRVRSLIDLKQFLHIVHPEEEGHSASMATMVERYFHLPMAKGRVSTHSANWHDKLSEEQKHYAATDALASLLLFVAIDADRRSNTTLLFPHDLAMDRATRQGTRQRTAQSLSANQMLERDLKKLREQPAYRDHVKQHRQIMSNNVLKTIAKERPETVDRLLKIRARHGAPEVGATYNDAILTVVK